MELLSTLTHITTEWTAESATEAANLKEITEAGAVGELAPTADFPLNEPVQERFQELLGESRYHHLGEYREAVQSQGEAARAFANDQHVKGQIGESLMEAALSQHGEVRAQVPVQLDGVPTGNIVDLHLTASDANLKQWQLTSADGEVFQQGNYDVLKRESAAFEVKNGDANYLRAMLDQGRLQQQIEAGKEISDHSFVVINEDCAQELMMHPAKAEAIIKEIEASGGKLIVGLPSEAVQEAILMS